MAAKPVRVAYVIPTLDMNEGGGILEFLYLLIKYLDRKHYQTDILVFYSDKAHADRFEKCGATVHIASYDKEANNYLSLFKWLSVKLKVLRPQVVHTNIYWADTLGREVAFKSNVPIVVTTEHNTNLTETTDQRKLKKKLSLKTDSIICNTNSVKNYSIDIDEIDPEKISVIPCAFNTAKYAAGINNITALSGKFYFVGRLVDQKQPLELIEAFAGIVGEVPDCKLICIGDGDLRNECQALIDSLDMTGSIFLAGYKENPFESIEDGSAFILNSSYEGQGIVLLEAMSKGLICIAPDCSGVVDVIRDGVNGFLFKTSDQADLTRVIHKVLSTDVRYLNHIRRQAYAEVTEKYSPEKMAESYMDIYKRLLHEKSASR